MPASKRWPLAPGHLWSATSPRASDEHGRLTVLAATDRLWLADEESAASRVIATRVLASTTGMSVCARAVSTRSGRSPPEARCTDVWRLEGKREIGLSLAPFSSTLWTPITGVTETATVPRTQAFKPSLFVWAKVMSRPTEDHTIQFSALPTSSHRQRNNCETRRRSSAIATALRQAGTRPARRYAAGSPSAPGASSADNPERLVPAATISMTALP